MDRLAASAAPVAISVGEMTPQSICTDYRQHVSIVTCIGADGTTVPPMFIFKGAMNSLPRSHVMDGCVPGSQFTQTGDPRLLCL